MYLMEIMLNMKRTRKHPTNVFFSVGNNFSTNFIQLIIGKIVQY